MENIIINYGDLVNELKNKKVRILGQNSHQVWGQFIIDEEGYIYKMIEDPYSRSYMDKLIENKITGEFKKIDFNIIPEWNRDIFSLEKTEEIVKIYDIKDYKRRLKANYS